MSIAPLRSSLLVGRRLPDVRALREAANMLAPFALVAAVGIELAVLVAWLPDTVRLGWNHPTGDFANLYEPARDLKLVGLYSPFVAPLLHPLTYLSELNAFRATFTLNCAAVLAVAYIAQRPMRSIEAKAAVALGVLSIPQLHWAVRLGHLTPMLTLITLVGLLLMSRKPSRGAIVLALLSLKPQYAVAPFLQLLRDRAFRAAAIMLGCAAAMAIVGFVAIGTGEAREYISIALDWGPDSSDNLLPVQQSWLYSWPGVQISAGIAPNPLITFQLIGLSLLTVALAWANTEARTRVAVTAFAMLLLTPYAQFYDFGLIAAGMALTLYAPLSNPVRAGVWLILWPAALITQDNTIFPATDALGAGHTDGFYWLTPAVLGVVAMLAVAGKHKRAVTDGD